MSVDAQLNHLLRYADEVVPPDGLREKLESGRKLRVKLGLDPTAPAVTLGWAVVLRKLRHFQEQGHTAVLIVGDFTAQVGDPSERGETRKRLSAEEVNGYAERVIDQFLRVLMPENLEIRRNSEWLAPLDMSAVLELTSSATVAQMLERSDFATRYRDQAPISVMEFLYPLLQGYDSVAVEADVELGGSDQLWNLMMGRVVQERYGQPAQVALTMPILVGVDGSRRMGQSLGNYIGVEETPDEMFGKTMSIPDEAMPQWFRLAADFEPAEVEEIEKGLASGVLHPGETKRRLARAVTALYWGEEAASASEAGFDRVFREGQAPQEIPQHRLDGSDPVAVPGLLRATGLVTSSSEGRRMLEQGAVRLDGEPLTEVEVSRERLVGAVIQVGKRRFLRLVE